MAKSTIKQKQQEEEYKKRMREKEVKPEQFFVKPKPQLVQKYCSECGHHWAWYSSDFGDSWQCSVHRKRAV